MLALTKRSLRPQSNRTQCIVYADDLATSCHGAESLQSCLDDLQVYCENNLLKVNVSTSSSRA